MRVKKGGWLREKIITAAVGNHAKAFQHPRHVFRHINCKLRVFAANQPQRNKVGVPIVHFLEHSANARRYIGVGQADVRPLVRGIGGGISWGQKLSI